MPSAPKNLPPVPESRIRIVNPAAIRPDGDYVLYWMISARRRLANFTLQHAVAQARSLGKPLLVLEALRCGYRWASDRLHAFVLQGMADNEQDFAAAGVTYLPYVEPAAGAGSGLLQALAKRACCVVSDDFPCFFLPRMIAAAAEQIDVRMEVVDGNGLLPMRATDRVFARAVDFPRFLQRELPPHLKEFPVGDALRGYDLGVASLPKEVAKRWPRATPAMLAADAEQLQALPIDHDVTVVAMRGGARAAGQLLRTFLSDRIHRYLDRSHPDADSVSGLSPYLHFGHISPHQVFAGIAKQESWSPDRIVSKLAGQRGWMGMSDSAEGFLDQLITWRELGYNYTSQRDDYEEFDSLPEWVQKTLGEHELDARPQVYTLEQFAQSETHDEVWNAAQRQLRETGLMHNYLRMLWGKKVLEWTRSPREAMAILIELNNRYALDGRNPNSYSGISWVLGRYDRPWAPRREIYGVIRYMSSANTVRKLRLKEYLATWGG